MVNQGKSGTGGRSTTGRERDGERDELVAVGRATPATVAGPVPVPTIEVADNAVSRALAEMRDEERW